MPDNPRCKSCRYYLSACKALAAKVASSADKELERQLILGTMHCVKKDAWVQPLCFCEEWEGE